MNIRTYEKIYGLDFANIQYPVIKYYNDSMILVRNGRRNLVTDINGNVKFKCVWEIKLLDNGCFYIENEDKHIITNAEGTIILSSKIPITVLKNGYCIKQGSNYAFYDILGTKVNEINNFRINLVKNEELFSATQLDSAIYRIVDDKGKIRNCKSKEEFLISDNFIVGIKGCIFTDAFGTIHTIYNRNCDILQTKRWPLYLKISFSNNILVLRYKEIYEYYKIKDDKMTRLNYFYIDEIHDNLRKVTRKVKKKQYLYGYIDIEGNEVIKPQFSSASDFDHGSAIADNKIIDKKGNILYDLDKYNFDNDTSHILKLGKLIFLKFDKYFLLLNTNEKFDYLKITSDNSATISKDGFYNVINAKGAYLLNKQYTNEVTDIYDNKLFTTIIDNENVTINSKENIILKSKEFIKVLSNGFILFKRGKYGVMDFSGNIIIEPSFSEIIYSNGKFILDGKILKSLPNKNSNYYHVSYNLDVTIDDKTMTKTFVNDELRQEYIEKLANKLKTAKIQYNEQLEKLNSEYKQNKLEIIEEKVYQKKLDNGGNL